MKTLLLLAFTSHYESQMSYWSNTTSVFCVSQTCLGQSVSNQTVVVLLRNPLLTLTATSRCVGSVHSHFHLLGHSFCSIDKFCLKYTNCVDFFLPFQLLNHPHLKLKEFKLSLCRTGLLSLHHHYITVQISNCICQISNCICIGCILTLLIFLILRL